MLHHQEYLQHLENYFDSRRNDTCFTPKLEYYKKEIDILRNLDLDPVRHLITSLYSPGKLKGARDPLGMLRSMILMILLKITSITKWVRQTKHDPFLAVLIGFAPDNVPGIGTYYDFMKRIVDGPYCKPCRCQNQVKRSKYNAGPHKRNLKEEKKAKKNDFDPNHSQSKKLAGELLKNSEEPRQKNHFKILEDLSILLGLIPTIKDGLITGLQDFIISGDGSILKTASSSRGKPECKCRSQGIYKCDHDRIYTTPTAKWCFNHITNSYDFGDRYYHLVITQNGHDFPLLTYMLGGNESDYTLSLTAFDHFEKAIREHGLGITISTFIGDGHHDSYAHYDFFEEKKVLPIIPLSKSSQNAYPHLPDDSDIRLDTDGVPLCPAGERMRHHCFDKKKQTHTYACPAKRNTHKNGKSVYVFHQEDCPKKQDCKPQSNLGPCVYLKSAMDKRMFPPLPRSSQKYQDLMNQRSASERCNFINDAYGVEKSSRNADYSLIRLTIANIAHHTSVRYEERKKRRAADAAVPGFIIEAATEKMQVQTDASAYG